jgi:ribose 5-phosphate isomerase B
MKIALASDHGGVELKAALAQALAAQAETVDFGPADKTSCDYSDYAVKVAMKVSSGAAEFGILICRSGIGMSMCANKHRGIRAALCSDTYSAKMTRLHNDANVLCLGARVIGSCLAIDIVDSFLSHPFEGGRHATRVDMMMDIENG